MTSTLYTMAECAGCERAKSFLQENGADFKVVPIDNPLLELAVAQLFHDGKAHAPVLVRKDGAVCLPTWLNDQVAGWARIAHIGTEQE